MKTSDLPPNVRPVADRHGKTRYRFRRAGWQTGYILAEPGTPAFMRRYAELLEGKIEPRTEVTAKRKPVPRSIEDAAHRMKASLAWQQQHPRTQHVYGRIIDRFCDTVSEGGRRYGDRLVESVTVVWLDRILAQYVDRPGAGTNLRKVLVRLFAFASAKLGWRADNPAAATDRFKSTGKGFHSWTDEEIATYRARHAYGTMARLVLELALNTAARRCNIAKIERDHLRDGKIRVAHVKGCAPTVVPILPETQRAIDALPAAPIRWLVVTEFGKPFTDAGLGNKMRQWCNEAGLEHCSMHGLRKAMSRILVESGATDAESTAVTGHRKDVTFIEYRKAANRERLAAAALSNLQDRTLVQPEES